MTRHRSVVVATVTAGLILTGTLVGASLKSSGQGVGSSLSGVLLPVSVAAIVGGDTASSLLQPGSSADVILRVSNPNHFTVVLVSVSANGTITSSGGIGTCTTSGVSFTNQSGLSVNVAGPGTTLVHLAGAASMDVTSLTGCQGATFVIPVSITVHRA